MQTRQIIEQIDAEIKRLQQAKSLLVGATTKRGPGRPAKTSVAAPKKRQMSPEGRARIAAAQKARWVKAKKAAK
jgi:hypothetical protein